MKSFALSLTFTATRKWPIALDLRLLSLSEHSRFCLENLDEFLVFMLDQQNEVILLSRDILELIKKKIAMGHVCYTKKKYFAP